MPWCALRTHWKCEVTIMSVCHSTNPDLVVSGSRDGSFALWDLRCDPKNPNGHGEACLMSSTIVKEAHNPTRRTRIRPRPKGASLSITSVLYLKDDISIATSGAADNVVKLWDTRNLKVLLETTPTGCAGRHGRRPARERERGAQAHQGLRPGKAAAAVSEAVPGERNSEEGDRAAVHAMSVVREWVVPQCVPARAAPDDAHARGGQDPGPATLPPSRLPSTRSRSSTSRASSSRSMPEPTPKKHKVAALMSYGLTSMMLLVTPSTKEAANHSPNKTREAALSLLILMLCYTAIAYRERSDRRAATWCCDFVLAAASWCYRSTKRTQRRLLLADCNRFKICTYPYVCCLVLLTMMTRN